MTKQEKLDTIRFHVIRVVPEIMDIKFGCVVIFDDKPATIITVYDDGSLRLQSGPNPMGDTILIFESESAMKGSGSIIGRDLTMEDILRTVLANKFEQSYDFMHYWCLGKPLHLQSDVTIDFIYETICL